MPRISNEEKAKRELIRDKFDLVSNFLNQIEEELLVNKDERTPDINKIAVAFGKASTHFTDIASLLNIYKEKE